jgi:predicted metalloendopeptidase
MKVHAVRISLLLFFSFFSLPVWACSAQSTDTLRFDVQAVDRSADPCADFYQYACGGWLKRNPIPADRSYWAVFPPMHDRNQRRVAAILDHAAHAPGSKDEQRIGDYFGLAAAVMGHELSHAFDDSGHKFDGEGNMRDWWTAEDAAHNDQRAACFVRQYSSYTIIDDVRVNGQLTRRKHRRQWQSAAGTHGLREPAAIDCRH